MNTRGLTELVILNVGRELGLIGDTLFTMMVVMALVTTLMTGPLLTRAYPKRRVARDIAEAERAALGDTVTTRALVVARPETDSSTLVEVAFGLLGATRPAEVVVAALEPQKEKLEMGSGLTDELAEMAATMERQQVLVKAGEDVGIPVRVRANPSSDLTGDLAVLAEALAPQYLVVWADDPAAPEVTAATDCPVVQVQPGTVLAGPLAVEWRRTATAMPRSWSPAGSPVARAPLWSCAPMATPGACRGCSTHWSHEACASPRPPRVRW